MDYLRVRNWDKFQHYKDRTPPWIKVYVTVLDDVTFANLPDAAKGHLMSLWVLASRMGNRLPADAVFLGRKINATEPLALKLLITEGFLESHPDSLDAASKLLAKCYTESDKETETETEKKHTTPTKPAADAAVEIVPSKSRVLNGTAADRALIDRCTLILGRQHTYSKSNVDAVKKAAAHYAPEQLVSVLDAIAHGRTPGAVWCRERLGSGLRLEYILRPGSGAADRILDELAAMPVNGYAPEANVSAVAKGREVQGMALIRGGLDDREGVGEGHGAARGLLSGSGPDPGDADPTWGDVPEAPDASHR